MGFGRYHKETNKTNQLAVSLKNQANTSSTQARHLSQQAKVIEKREQIDKGRLALQKQQNDLADLTSGNPKPPARKTLGHYRPLNPTRKPSIQ